MMSLRKARQIATIARHKKRKRKQKTITREVKKDVKDAIKSGARGLLIRYNSGEVDPIDFTTVIKKLEEKGYAVHLFQRNGASKMILVISWGGVFRQAMLKAGEQLDDTRRRPNYEKSLRMS